MQGHDIAFLQQLWKLRVLRAQHLHFRPFAAAPDQHAAAEGPGDLRHPAGDGAAAHQAQGLPLQLPAHQTGGAAAALYCPVAFAQAAIQSKDKAEGMFRHGLGGVARGVAHGDLAYLGRIQGHVIHAGEGHGDHFQAVAVVDDRRRQRLVAQYQHVGLAHGLDQLFPVGDALRDGGKAVAGGKQRRGQFL